MDLKPGEPQPGARWIGPEQCQGLLELRKEQLLRRGQGEAQRKAVWSQDSDPLRWSDLFRQQVGESETAGSSRGRVCYRQRLLRTRGVSY